MEQKERKVLLSLKNVEVKFNVRGRILTAIRNVSLDIYETASSQTAASFSRTTRLPKRMSP